MENVRPGFVTVCLYIYLEVQRFSISVRNQESHMYCGSIACVQSLVRIAIYFCNSFSNDSFWDVHSIQQKHMFLQTITSNGIFSSILQILERVRVVVKWRSILVTKYVVKIKQQESNNCVTRLEAIQNQVGRYALSIPDMIFILLRWKRLWKLSLRFAYLLDSCIKDCWKEIWKKDLPKSRFMSCHWESL